MKFTQLIKTCIAAVAIVALSAAPIEAQKKRAAKSPARKTAATAASAVTKGAVKQLCPELSVQTFTLKRRNAKFSIDYPVSGNPQLVNALRVWTKNMVCDNFTGSLDSPDALMKKAAASVERDENYELTLTYPYASDKVVTADLSGYLYSGGAHGMPSQAARTFLCTNGKPLTTEMLPPFNDIRNYVVDGLIEYCGVSSKSELSDILSVGLSELSYDCSNVFVDDKGLNIRYDVYCIAPYYAGFPLVTIPKSKILPLLSAEAKAYFE